MNSNISKIWKSENTQQLALALTIISSEIDMKNFLRDVMTEKEIVEISARLQAAKLLTEGIRYAEIVSRTKLSSRTVARISDWLKNGCNGYQVTLKTLTHHHGHILPVRAE
jgi:TrpR-related protein YerC/YecD